MKQAAAGDLLKALRNLNPWWETGEVHADYVHSFRRSVFFEAMEGVLAQSRRRVVVLSGLSRVGKTTVMYQMIDALLKSRVSSKKIVYVPLRHALFKLYGLVDILTCYEVAVYSRHDAYFFLDDLPCSSDWEYHLHLICGIYPQTTVVASGSAVPKIILPRAGVQRFPEAERTMRAFLVLKAVTLSFYEYCGLIDLKRPPERCLISPLSFAALPGPAQAELIRRLSFLEAHLERYLVLGGFPETALSARDLGASRRVFEDVLSVVLRRDIPEAGPVKNTAELERVLLYLCGISSDVVSIDAMRRALTGVSRTAMEDGIRSMETANLIHISHPVGQRRRRGAGGPKIYISDAAIRNALFCDNQASLSAIDMGKIVEGAVYKHLLALYYRSAEQIGYFRSEAEGKEIDIVVVEADKKPILVEVKYRRRVVINSNDAIWHTSSEVEAAFVVTRSASDYGIQRNAHGLPLVHIPAFAFLYLLGFSERHRSALAAE